MRRPHALIRRAAGLWALAACAFAPSHATAAGPTGDGQPTLERMIGQMLMVGFPGRSPQSPGARAIAEEIKAGRVGGVILFRHNVGSLGEVRALTRSLHRASAGRLFVAVDQEGGRVQRLTRRAGFTETPAAATVAARHSPEGANALYRRLARDLVGLGINYNLAPVVDLNTNPNNPIIGRLGRAYAADPAMVGRYAAAFVRAHRDAGVATSLKHFPGHGSSRADTHKRAVDVTRTWQPTELQPYRAMMDAGLADSVMVAHVELARFGSPAGRPATLSRALVTDLLRGKLGYDGVVMSDDMDMAAIRRDHRRGEAAVAAVRAGVDVLIYAGHRAEPRQLVSEVHGALLAAARADPALRRSIARSYQRIVRLKAQIPVGVPLDPRIIAAGAVAPLPRKRPDRPSANERFTGGEGAAVGSTMPQPPGDADARLALPARAAPLAVDAPAPPENQANAAAAGVAERQDATAAPAGLAAKPQTRAETQRRVLERSAARLARLASGVPLPRPRPGERSAPASSAPTSSASTLAPRTDTVLTERERAELVFPAIETTPDR